MAMHNLSPPKKCFLSIAIQKPIVSFWNEIWLCEKHTPFISVFTIINGVKPAEPILLTSTLLMGVTAARSASICITGGRKNISLQKHCLLLIITLHEYGLRR